MVTPAPSVCAPLSFAMYSHEVYKIVEMTIIFTPWSATVKGILRIKILNQARLKRDEKLNIMNDDKTSVGPELESSLLSSRKFLPLIFSYLLDDR